MFNEAMFHHVRTKQPVALKEWANKWADNRSTDQGRRKFVRDIKNRVLELQAEGLDRNALDGGHYEDLMWFVPMLKALYQHPDFTVGNMEEAMELHREMMERNPDWWEPVLVKGYYHNSDPITTPDDPSAGQNPITTPDDPSAGQKRKRD